MSPLAPALARLSAAGGVIVVTLARAAGSTPREAGASMLVSAAGTHGTIGGGQLEYHAVDVARGMLRRGEARAELDLPLGPVLGQCCGGRVLLLFEAADAGTPDRLAGRDRDEAARRSTVLVFGHGHTGRALARALAPLPFAVSVIDDRPHELHDPAPGVRTLLLDDPAEALDGAPPGFAALVLTHSHALDYRLADAALRRGDAAYVGMIGSATKRARFERWLLERGGPAEALARLTCPIGGADVPDKRPSVIAALTAAELVRALAARPGTCLPGPAGAASSRRGKASPATSEARTAATP